MALGSLCIFCVCFDFKCAQRATNLHHRVFWSRMDSASPAGAAWRGSLWPGATGVALASAGRSGTPAPSRRPLLFFRAPDPREAARGPAHGRSPAHESRAPAVSWKQDAACVRGRGVRRSGAVSAVGVLLRVGTRRVLSKCACHSRERRGHKLIIITMSAGVGGLRAGTAVLLRPFIFLSAERGCLVRRQGRQPARGLAPLGGAPAGGAPAPRPPTPPYAQPVACAPSPSTWAPLSAPPPPPVSTPPPTVTHAGSAPPQPGLSRSASAGSPGGAGGRPRRHSRA